MSISKKILFCNFICFIFGVKYLQAQGAQANIEAQQKLKQVSKQFFIENKGQWPKEVLYLTQSAGLNTWITTKGMWYEFYKTEEMNPVNKLMPNEFVMPEKFERTETKRWGHRVGYTLVGNNKSVKTETKQKQEGYYNYFIGNDPSKHASYVGLYKEALVKEVYKGIDMRYYFDKGQLRYDYVIEPGADPSQICFKFEGAENSYINEKGELVFTTCFGEVKNADLYTYQEENKLQVKSKFIKTDEGFSFDLGNYNKSQTLIIDPLIYSTYLGGGDNEISNYIVVDSTGNAYISGHTKSPNYDITAGAFQMAHTGDYDVFVTKLNASASALVFSTFIGGSVSDYSMAITLDTSDNVYIIGFTNSADYATTLGALHNANAGPIGTNDVFVSKLDKTGTFLIYSTYLGGAGDDHGYSISVDVSGNAYITGLTYSSNFDISPGAFQITKDYGSDIFVSKINSIGSALIYSTYIGGSFGDIGTSIVTDIGGNAYITGATSSANYDITPGSLQTTLGGAFDVFVSKLNPAGTALNYSTYIGGNGDDQAYSIALDASNNAYITGFTNSTNYNNTIGSFQTTNAGKYDVMVSKLNAMGTALVYSTYIGGNYNDKANGISVDSLGNAYIIGETDSNDFDITPGAFQITSNGLHDAFVCRLSASGASLVYSTYLGGSSWDQGRSITLKNSGIAYISGVTTSTNFTTTPGVFNTAYTGWSDVFVCKLDLQGSTFISEITEANLFNLYPNPSQGIFQIDFGNSGNNHIQIEILDMQGNLIEKQNLSNKNSTNIDLSKYASGVYILKVVANNKQEIARLVKL